VSPNILASFLLSWRLVGYSVFRYRPAMVDSTIWVLYCLRQQSFRLYLHTAGDTDVQRRKIHDLGLASYFEAIYIVGSGLLIGSFGTGSSNLEGEPLNYYGHR
jgi:phosphoglycolate phosphatase-like HAD superfamily hydrolase